MIRPVLVALTTMIATVVAGGPAAAANLRNVPAANAVSKLRLDASQSSERQASKVYIVQMVAQPGPTYQGNVAGFAKTAPEAGKRYDAQSGQAQMYARHLVSQHDAALVSVGAANRKIYSYVHALNGFAARLTPQQAMKLSKNKSVLKVWEDRLMPVDTNNSPRFLGLLNQTNGLRAAHDLTGEGMIIGVIDTGIWPEHPSFADNNYDPPPAHWNGVCQSGEGWSSANCSNKLIGARWFASGFTSTGDLAEGEFLSARDSDGHGTHTASTAGGNRTKATLNDNPAAPISGMAYRAHVAVYKACWTGPDFSTLADDGCTFSDSAAATDAAVADGVDVINFSVGTSAAFDDPQDIAFLFAADAGVFVARSGGNTGPGFGTTSAGEPWVTTVGASTQRGTSFVLATTVNAPGSVAGDYPSLEGAITQPLSESGVITDDVVAANPIEACGAGIDPIDGIALIARGTCTFDEKITNAVDAGASAVIVYTQADTPKTIMGGATTQPIPGVMVNNDIGVALLAELNNAVTVNATLDPDAITTEAMTGNLMAGFSSRGAFPTVPSWIKPDVSAPGVMILAGGTPEPADGSAGGLFQYLDGTSMATPHVAGVGALLRQANPTWSPAAIKSSLMTTARRSVKKEDGVTNADPFDFGAGHIVPNLARDPGLVYDTDFFGYVAASCGTVTPLVDEDFCGFLRDDFGLSLDPSDLNLASIGADSVIGTKVITRTVTNVGDAPAVYSSTITPPPGFRVDVSPTEFTLQPGESTAYEVTIRNRNAPAGAWRFGSLTWTDGTHLVRSPIAVKAQTLVAPAEVTGSGADGSTSFDVTFGYSGDYTAAPHGLVDPFLTLFEVTDDPNNSFDFDFGSDEPIVYLLDLPEGTAYAQWDLYNVYNDDEGHDLDLYLFYCPGFSCTQVDASFNADSDERVSVTFPVTNGAPADPNDADDPYVLFVHGFNTAGGAPASGILFDWTVVDDEGNLMVTAPASAVRGQTVPVDLSWTGLTTGAGAKQSGAVSHSDANGIIGLTIVNIENDPGAGYCDLVDCGP